MGLIRPRMALLVACIAALLTHSRGLLLADEEPVAATSAASFLPRSCKGVNCPAPGLIPECKRLQGTSGCYNGACRIWSIVNQPDETRCRSDTGTCQQGECVAEPITPSTPCADDTACITPPVTACQTLDRVPGCDGGFCRQLVVTNKLDGTPCPGGLCRFGQCANSTALCRSRTIAITCTEDASRRRVLNIAFNNEDGYSAAVCRPKEGQVPATAVTTTHTLFESDSISKVSSCKDAVSGSLLHASFRAITQEYVCGRPRAEVPTGAICNEFTLGVRTFTGENSYKKPHPLSSLVAKCDPRTGLIAGIKRACFNAGYKPALEPCYFLGTGRINSVGGCDDCAIGYYNPGGLSTCAPCPEGTSTATMRSERCFKLCSPGSGLIQDPAAPPPNNFDTQDCQVCPEGSWSPGGPLSSESGSAVAKCVPCPGSFMTTRAGATRISQCTCAAGYGITKDWPTVCQLCPVGTFSRGAAPGAAADASGVAPASTPSPFSGPSLSPCVPCCDPSLPAGQCKLTTRQPGSTSFAQCVPQE